MVSIIIPVYNKLELTHPCLISLLAYTPPGSYEIIVVDNGSTDGTAEWLRQHEAAGHLRAVFPGENLGFARGSNLGAQHSAGRYLLFLNNDTEVTPGWLEPLVEILDRDPTVGAVGSKLLFPDGRVQHGGVAVVDVDLKAGKRLIGGRHLGWGQPGDNPEHNRSRVCQVLTAACLLMRRHVFEAAGGFDDIYWNGNEDVDLCFKLGQAGWRLVYEPASVVVHHESQSGEERWRKIEHNEQVLDSRWRGRVEPDFVVDARGKGTSTGAGKIVTYVMPSYDDPQPAAAGAPPTASVIVLTYNALAYTQRCVESLFRHTDARHELIFVDNGSTDGTPSWLSALARREPRVRVQLNADNLGFAAGNNQGIAMAQGDHVVLLNSDTVVTEGWLERMLAVFAREPRVGLVGPVTNSVSGPQQLAAVSYDPVSLDGLAAFAAARAQACAGQTHELLCAVGYCLLIRRRLLQEIGGLDEGYGQGNYEDTDFCLRAFLAGWRTMMADDCFIHHFGSRSFAAARIDYAAQITQKFEIFKRKWNLPADTQQGGKVPLESLWGGGFQPGLHIEPLAAGPRLLPLAPTEWHLDDRIAAAEKLFACGHLEGARRTLLSVLRWRPDAPRAASDLAVINWQQGDIAEARRLLEDVLAKHPDHEDASANLEAIAAPQGH